MRRFVDGQIVGEVDPPLTLPEIIKWAEDERQLATKKLSKEGQLSSRAALSIRAATLAEVLLKLEQLPQSWAPSRLNY
jgi:hypothetical protein